MHNVFFASSSAARNRFGFKLVELLRATRRIAVTPWWEDDVFKAGTYTLEALRGGVERFDAAIFLFAADDRLRKTKKGTTASTRDNVVLEFGLFLTRLGPQRCVILKEPEVAVPTDVEGLTYLPLPGRGTVGQAFADALEEVAGTIARQWKNGLAPKPGERSPIRDGGLGVRVTLQSIAARLDTDVAAVGEYDLRRNSNSEKPLEFDSAHCVQALIEGLDSVQSRFWATTWLHSRFWAGANPALATSNTMMATRVAKEGSARRLFLLNQSIEDELAEMARARLHDLDARSHDKLIQSRDELQQLRMHVVEQVNAGFDVRVAQHRSDAVGLLPTGMRTLTDRPAMCLFDDKRVDILEAGREGRVYSSWLYAPLATAFPAALRGAEAYFAAHWEDERLCVPMQDFLERLDEQLDIVEGSIRHIEGWIGRRELDLPKEDEDTLADEQAFYVEQVQAFSLVNRWCDVGTCTGALVRSLLGVLGPQCEVIAIDRDAGCVSFANRRLADCAGRVQVLLADWNSEFDPEGLFDLVTCGLGTISYWRRNQRTSDEFSTTEFNDELQAGLQKCALQLRQGGLLLLTTWSDAALEHMDVLPIYTSRDKDLLKAWSPRKAELRERLRQCKLKVVKNKVYDRIELWACTVEATAENPA